MVATLSLSWRQSKMEPPLSAAVPLPDISVNAYMYNTGLEQNLLL